MHSRRGLLLGLPFLFACRGQRQKAIGVIPKATSHLFFLSVHAGVDQAARDPHVDALGNGPDDETEYERQIQIVDAMIARQVAGLAISATDDRPGCPARTRHPRRDSGHRVRPGGEYRQLRQLHRHGQSRRWMHGGPEAGRVDRR
jgi:hypothetical protein